MRKQRIQRKQRAANKLVNRCIKYRAVGQCHIPVLLALLALLAFCWRSVGAAKVSIS
jgi:hypothetical protein